MSETNDAGPEARTESDAPATDKFAHLSAFQRDVLRVLDQSGPSKGLAVKDALTSYYGEEVNHSRLYPNLDALADAGLVAKRERDGRTNEYELTERGRRALRARRRWTASGGASA